MFDNYLSAGKHMICDLKDINNTELLNNAELLNKMLKDICRKYNFEILNEIEHSFHPIGCSILFLLSESHISIHTFPEKNYISLDIYTCRQYNDNLVYNDIYAFIINKLNASQISSTCNIIDKYF